MIRTLAAVAVVFMLLVASVFAQTIQVVQPETSVWPLFMLFGVLTVVVGLVVLRIKKPDEYARIMRSVKKAEEGGAELYQRLHEQAKEARNNMAAVTATTDIHKGAAAPEPAGPPPGYL